MTSEYLRSEETVEPDINKKKEANLHHIATLLESMLLSYSTNNENMLLSCLKREMKETEDSCRQQSEMAWNLSKGKVPSELQKRHTPLFFIWNCILLDLSFGAYRSPFHRATTLTKTRTLFNRHINQFSSYPKSSSRAATVHVADSKQ